MPLRRLTLTSLLLPWLLTACSDNEPTPQLPEQTATSTPSQTPDTGPTEPTPPPQIQGDDAQAAEAFVEYYYRHINYAQLTGDTEGLRNLGLPSCEACDGGADFIDAIYERGGRATGGEYRLVSTTVTGRQQVTDDVSVFFVEVVARHTEQVVTGAGNLSKTYPSGRSRLRYRILRDVEGWHIDEWKLI